MLRAKYRYNPATCKYEPYHLRGKVLWHRILFFVSLSLLVAFAGFAWFTQQIGSIDEILLTKKNDKLKKEWKVLQKRLAIDEERLSAFIDKDDNNYRVVLDSSPLPADVREAGVGGSAKTDLSELESYPLLLTPYQKLDKLKRQIDIEVQSFDEMKILADDRVEMWASRPAIQPINNKELDRLHMTYGTRFHPIFHVFKEHKGLDFTASKGTPVYATGDGRIGTAHYSDSYGNVIYLIHGHDYETRYAHLSQFNVQEGQRVKRGQVIGYVGSTGTSVSAHLHYEVLYKGQHVNPINFFQRDLSNKEYEKLIEIGSRQFHALD